MSRFHDMSPDTAVPVEDRKQFILENAVPLVNRMDFQIEQLRKRIRSLEKANHDLRIQLQRAQAQQKGRPQDYRKMS